MSNKNNLFREDERELLNSAVEDVRKRGFGEVVLCFRNGYIYRVKVTFEDYNITNTESLSNKGKK